MKKTKKKGFTITSNRNYLFFITHRLLIFTVPKMYCLEQLLLLASNWPNTIHENVLQNLPPRIQVLHKYISGYAATLFEKYLFLYSVFWRSSPNLSTAHYR